jgi:hypothetical protein
MLFTRLFIPVGYELIGGSVQDTINNGLAAVAAREHATA